MYQPVIKANVVDFMAYLIVKKQLAEQEEEYHYKIENAARRVIF